MISAKNHHRTTQRSRNLNDSLQVNSEQTEYATANILKCAKPQNAQQPTVGGSVDYAVPIIEGRRKSRQGEKQQEVFMLEAPSYPAPVYSYAKVPKKSQAVLAQAAESTSYEASSNVHKRSPTPEYAAVAMDFTDKEVKEAEQNHYHSLENPNECSTVDTENYYHCLENPDECSTVETDMNVNGIFDSDIYTKPGMPDSRSKAAQQGWRMKNHVFPSSQPNYDKFCYQEGGIDNEDHYYHSLENPTESYTTV